MELPELRVAKVINFLDQLELFRRNQIEQQARLDHTSCSSCFSLLTSAFKLSMDWLVAILATRHGWSTLGLPSKVSTSEAHDGQVGS
jgi:hypothetical protein